MSDRITQFYLPPNKGDVPQPKPVLNVIAVNASEHFGKGYYATTFVPQQELNQASQIQSPACYN